MHTKKSYMVSCENAMLELEYTKLLDCYAISQEFSTSYVSFTWYMGNLRNTPKLGTSETVIQNTLNLKQGSS